MQPCRFGNSPRFVRETATLYHDADSDRKYTMFGLVELYNEEQDAHYHYETLQKVETKYNSTEFDLVSGC